MFRAYEHELEKGRELILMLWNDSGATSTTITIASTDYHYPVRINSFNYHTWTDVAHRFDADNCTLELQVDQNITIIRLFQLENKNTR